MQHQTHDHTLIAGLAASDLTGSDLARARSLLDSCTSCVELHADLIAIAAATRALPNLATAPRDFRLDAAQAARLTRRSWLRTILAPFAGARSAARPAAVAFTSLGLVGLLVTASLPGMLGGATMAPTARDLASGPEASLEAVQAPGAGNPGGAPVPAGTDSMFGGMKDGSSQGTGGDSSEAGGIPSESTAKPATDLGIPTGRTSTFSPVSVLLAGSFGLLALGLVLFGLRFAARRIR